MEYEKELSEEDIRVDFSKTYRVCVDSDIQLLDTDNREEILSALRESNYVWEIFAQVDDHQWSVTIARGNAYDDEACAVLTEEQKQEVKDNAGRWMISCVSVDIEWPDYMETLEASQKTRTGEETMEYVLVGGIPGIQDPIGIAFDDTEAK